MQFDFFLDSWAKTITNTGEDPSVSTLIVIFLSGTVTDDSRSPSWNRKALLAWANRTIRTVHTLRRLLTQKNSSQSGCSTGLFLSFWLLLDYLWKNGIPFFSTVSAMFMEDGCNMTEVRFDPNNVTEIRISESYYVLVWSVKDPSWIFSNFYGMRIW